MADFLRMIKAHTTTELLQMVETDRLTTMQLRAIRAEIKSREI
jgi:hypothetical protein